MATLDGSPVFGLAVKVQHSPHPNAQQMNAFFGINGVQTLFGGQRGRTLLISGVLVGNTIGDINAAENALLGNVQRVTHEIVATGSFTDPEYGSVGLTEAQARERGDCVVAVVRYDDVPRAVIDSRTDGFCKLIVDPQSRQILGAHVLGEYSAEVIQVAAACMAASMQIEQVAALQLAFPTFTEALGLAAQRIARELGIVRAIEFREQ